MERIHDFPQLARESGFVFPTKPTRLDWKQLEELDLEAIVCGRKFSELEKCMDLVLTCDLESETAKFLDKDFVKLFRVSQLGIAYLSHCLTSLDQCVILLQDQLAACKQESKKRMINRDEKLDVNQAQKCKLCNKSFLSESYLISHTRRRHAPVTTSTGTQTKIRTAEACSSQTEVVAVNSGSQTEPPLVSSTSIQTEPDNSACVNCTNRKSSPTAEADGLKELLEKFMEELKTHRSAGNIPSDWLTNGTLDGNPSLLPPFLAHGSHQPSMPGQVEPLEEAQLPVATPRKPNPEQKSTAAYISTQLRKLQNRQTTYTSSEDEDEIQSPEQPKSPIVAPPKSDAKLVRRRRTKKYPEAWATNVPVLSEQSKSRTHEESFIPSPELVTSPVESTLVPPTSLKLPPSQEETAVIPSQEQTKSPPRSTFELPPEKKKASTPPRLPPSEAESKLVSPQARSPSGSKFVLQPEKTTYSTPSRLPPEEKPKFIPPQEQAKSPIGSAALRPPEKSISDIVSKFSEGGSNTRSGGRESKRDDADMIDWLQDEDTLGKPAGIEVTKPAGATRFGSTLDIVNEDSGSTDGSDISAFDMKQPPPARLAFDEQKPLEASSPEPKELSFTMKQIGQPSLRPRKTSFMSAVQKKVKKSITSMFSSVSQPMATKMEMSERLKELHVDPNWKSIPDGTLKKCKETLHHNRLLLAKKYPSFNETRSHIEQEMLKRLSDRDRTTVPQSQISQDNRPEPCVDNSSNRLCMYDVVTDTSGESDVVPTETHKPTAEATAKVTEAKQSKMPSALLNELQAVQENKGLKKDGVNTDTETRLLSILKKPVSPAESSSPDDELDILVPAPRSEGKKVLFGEVNKRIFESDPVIESSSSSGWDDVDVL